jgi:hypothetical protein
MASRSFSHSPLAVFFDDSSKCRNSALIIRETSSDFCYQQLILGHLEYQRLALADVQSSSDIDWDCHLSLFGDSYRSKLRSFVRHGWFVGNFLHIRLTFQIAMKQDTVRWMEEWPSDESLETAIKI